MKIAIQHFNFDVLHIDGKDNIEADALSRLTPFPTKDEHNISLNSLEQSEMIEVKSYLKNAFIRKFNKPITV